jgi:negative regulator of flagellin synthesis FlgM
MSVKISNDSIDKISSEYIQRDLKRIKENEDTPANFVADDQVELSTEALDLKQMQVKTMSFPDVRTEKVDQIKMQVENGTYKISPGKIAERLIEDSME